MERKDLGEDFRFYPPSGVGIPCFLSENSINNEALPPQHRLDPLPPSLNSQVRLENVAVGDSSLSLRTMSENQSPANLSYWEGNDEARPLQHHLGPLQPLLNRQVGRNEAVDNSSLDRISISENQSLEILNIYWKGNVEATPPQNLLGRSQVGLEKAAVGNSSLNDGAMSENQSLENLNIYWKGKKEASPPQHRLGLGHRKEDAAVGNSSPSRRTMSENQSPENLNIYWKGDIIEEATHSSHRRNQEQQFPVPGSSNSNNFDIETAMSLLSLSNTANNSSANGGGGGHGANYGANFFDPISYRRLPSYVGTSNGLGPSSPNRDERRFSVAVQRQLRRERINADSVLLSRDSNTLLYPCSNARFQQPLFVLSLDELRGQLYSMAKDQHGSSFLEKKLLEGNPVDIEIIYWEIKDYICELMVHQFAHHVVDKLIEVGDPLLVTGVLHTVVSNEHNFIALCNDPHGTHGVQKLLEHLTTREQISMAVSVLRRVLLILSKDIHGQHVIKCCVNRFTSRDNKDLLNEVAINCLEIARDKTGCCLLQDCVVRAEGKLKENLLESIISNSLVLSKDPYGNFVVQNALQQNIPYVTEEVIKRLRGNFTTLCFDKFGSHVVERCLSGTNDQINKHIITELIYSQDFLSVVQSPFGNYVIQTALMTSKGVMHNALVNKIQDDYAFLYSHPFGRKVLLKVRDTRTRSFIP